MVALKHVLTTRRPNGGYFFPQVISPSTQKIYIEFYFLNERFNNIELEIDSGNESQVKATRKPPLLLRKEESLVKKVKKNIFLFEKKSDISKIFSLSKTFALFSLFDYFLSRSFFFSIFLENKNNIISNSSFFTLISAK